MLCVNPLSNTNNFSPQDNAILLRLESLKEWFVFHDLSCILKCRLEYISISLLIYNTLRLIFGLFFSNFFQLSFPNG